MTDTSKKDILEYLQCMVNTETPTPPKVVNDMLDLIPESVWLDDNATILCPSCKDGIFLREATIRILRKKYEALGPIEFRKHQDEIVYHILRHRMFGIAISYRGYRVTKRSLYTCSNKFAGIDNIYFNENYGRYVQDKSGKEVEKQCFHFIENIDEVSKFFEGKGVKNMHFDVIIGNPPYQTNDGGAGASATPIFHLFVEQAIKLMPSFLTMIIPAKWYAGGKGLDGFRRSMLNDERLSIIHDYKSGSDCFAGVEIKGGVMYFLWDKNHSGETDIIEHVGNDIVSQKRRPLLENGIDVFIRHNNSLPILQKVIKCNPEILKGDSFSTLVSSRKPFGFPTNFTKFDKKKSQGMVQIYANKTIGYVKPNQIEIHKEWVPKWKVLTAKANNIGTESPDDNLNTIVVSPNTCCTETYLVVGADLNMNESMAKNVATYLHTRFVRFLISLRKPTQDAVSKVYLFVPIQDFREEWTDEKLYKKYNLTKDEIAFIESMIKPMDISNSDIMDIAEDDE